MKQKRLLSRRVKAYLQKAFETAQGLESAAKNIRTLQGSSQEVHKIIDFSKQIPVIDLEIWAITQRNTCLKHRYVTTVARVHVKSAFLSLKKIQTTLHLVDRLIAVLLDHLLLIHLTLHPLRISKTQERIVSTTYLYCPHHQHHRCILLFLLMAVQ